MSADRTMGPLLLNLRQRITLLERRIIRAARGGVPYGVAIPFFGQPSSIPRRYVQPMGQTVSRTTYRRIFEVVGTHYGAGNGSTTFVLPDLRGRTLVGLHAGDSDFGTLGQRVGAKTHTLTSAQIPNLSAASAGAHSHSGTAASAGSHSHGFPSGRAVVSTDAGVNLYVRNAAPGTMPTISMANGATSSVTEPTATGSGGAHSHSVSTVSAGAHTHTVNSGGGGAHNNIQPSFACPWIMRY